MTEHRGADPARDGVGGTAADRERGPAADAARLFAERFGSPPAGVWSSPGRANLIGEHTDHAGGLVLPFAIDYRAAVAIGPNPDGVFRAVSAQRPGPPVILGGDDLRPGTTGRGWQGYVFGVAWALRRAGHRVPALDFALASDVPAGAGLSSSAAVECAVGLAISDHVGLGLPVEEIARLAQRAENDFVGVPCGLMDQMASAASIAGHALYFDVGSGRIEHIPFDPRSAGLDVLVIDTRAHHSLADGEYARRRAECERAREKLGLGSLSDVGAAELDAVLARLGSEVLGRRVRHVVTENERVRRVVALLRDGAIAAVGPELRASHASLRDDFQVSCAELDLAAARAEDAGAFGARMIGGGFGGSVIALVPHEQRSAVEDAVTAAFAGAGFDRPRFRAVAPAAGAHRDR